MYRSVFIFAPWLFGSDLIKPFHDQKLETKTDEKECHIQDHTINVCEKTELPGEETKSTNEINNNAVNPTMKDEKRDLHKEAMLRHPSIIGAIFSDERFVLSTSYLEMIYGPRDSN